MKYYRSRFNNSLEIIKGYTYPEPFHLYIKSYFKKNKKFGSKDRKAITECCYSYFRTGLMFKDLKPNERLLLSTLFLPLDRIDDWNLVSNELGYRYKITDEVLGSLEAKVEYLNAVIKIDNFTFYPADRLMAEFEEINHIENLTYRPKNWAKNHNSSEEGELGIKGCFELDGLQDLPREIQVQDLSSQYICSKISIEEKSKVWDVCCGAGGKSLNLLASGNGEFFLSDLRTNILSNAKSRLKALNYSAKYGLVDLSKALVDHKIEGQLIHDEFFDVIIADVPCSGSGTWFRNPEHFSNYKYPELSQYANRQKTIVKNSIGYLKTDGLFYYITCSVFKAENTVVKDWILATQECELVDEVIFNGVDHNSDAMYMACFRKTE